MDAKTILTKFSELSATDIVAADLDPKVEIGLTAANVAANVGLGMGTFKLISKVVDPVIKSEPKLPIRIAYGLTKYCISAAVSTGVQSYVSNIFQTVRVGLKAKKIIDGIKEEENGTDTEQVHEA